MMLRQDGCNAVIPFIVLLVLPAFAALAPGSARAQPQDEGKWSEVFPTPNVMIHASVLPNRKVLFWSRREWTGGHPVDNSPKSLDPHDCTPRLWDPSKGTGPDAFSTTSNKPGYNLFCSGHTFLADGRLFVVGGHLSDSHGSPQATIYDPASNKWTAIEDTKGGRWYPTAVTLPDGGVLVSFGSTKEGKVNHTQQVWKDGHWRDVTVEFGDAPLYPRMHVVPDDRVFFAGPNALTQFFDPGADKWTPLSDRKNKFRDYAPSVLYDEGKILFIGGGNAPTKAAEVLDLNAAMPAWKPTEDMNLARRQHNATLLPDGTVLVMGGTQGNGGPGDASNGFDDLRIGQPIRSAELWNPKNGKWTKLAKADVDRCYHSIAVLLPDATVLSAGGGEYRPDGQHPNDLKFSHSNAQIFSPPYLFGGSGTRPKITSAPDEVHYGETFPVGTPNPGRIAQANWVRLSSVTHSFNSNQRINFLRFTADSGGLQLTAPANAKLCPPGHYMLFLIDRDGVPSVAKIIKIG